MWLVWLVLSLVGFLILYCYFVTQKSPPFVFPGAHVIITGGSSGIGLELALELTRRGSNVTILARDETKLKEASQKIEKVRSSSEQKILWYSCDVSSERSLSETIDKAVASNKGKVDALICSAGVTSVTRFLETSPAAMEKLMNINFNGSAYATHACLKYMKEQRSGRVIYVSSLLGLMGAPGYAVYSASKFALRGLAECLHTEMSSFNVYFSIATPSNVLTPMFEEEEKTKAPEAKAIEAASGQTPVSAKAVSDDIISCLSDWRFVVATGMDPWLVSNITSGFSPASFTEFLTQPVIALVGRLFALWEVRKMRTIVKKHYK